MSRPFSLHYKPTTLTPRAKSRLLRDLREIETNPLPTVAALPLPYDIGTWHVNLRPADGPFEGSVFHFRLQFPRDYPAHPPTVEMLSTGMPGHPNVFGDSGHVYICLSMLKPHTASVKYDGWTSAYSCMSLLLQLQSFLFAETIEQDYVSLDARAYGTADWTPGAIRRVRRANSAFFLQIDDETAHSHDAPWPPFADAETLSTAPLPAPVRRRRELVAECHRLKAQLRQIDELQISTRELEARTSHGFGFGDLSYKEVAVLSHGRAALPQLLGGKAGLEARLVARRGELEADERLAQLARLEAAERARRSEAAFAELPGDLLVMVADRLRAEDLPALTRVCTAWRDVARANHLFARRQLCCFYSKERYGGADVLLGVGLNLQLHAGGGLKEVSTPFDLISEAAFSRDGARLSVWKAPFTHFLPLAIDARHFARALPLLERLTKQAFGAAARTTHLLELLAAAMNSMVVQLFTAHCAAAGAPPLHASEVALDGYCAFHQLLLCSAQRWPHIRAEAERRVRAFLECEDNRHKRATPDLGRLLVCLTLSSRGWAAVRYPFLREMLSRNVRWAVQKKARLGALSPPHAPSAAARASLTFDASLTSLRLVAFQIFFLHVVGRPAGTTGPFDVLAQYEQRLGRPNTTQRSQLQAMAKRTLQLSSWREFFVLVGAAVPDAPTLHGLLVGAVRASEAKGYHSHRAGGAGRGRHGGGGRASAPA
mmetsp:Transcript_40332/g.94129  ORF Transcript_40332/g.94129 Transcript_40332/m.94129 type:complete len:715 (-) Transcript_40332:530-2674(-)